MPGDLGRYYDRDYHMLPDSIEALARSAEVHEQFKIDILKPLKPGGRLIEVGPGAGGFALLAKRAGFDVNVIDLSKTACDWISSTLGVRAIHTADEVQSLEREQPADVIALWQVLEHLPKPLELLKVAAARLRPGGILLVAAPNPHALQLKLFRQYWTHLDCPRHVVLISPRELVSVASANGLTALWVTMTDRGSLYWNQFGWEYSLRNLFGTGAPSDRIRRYAALAGRFAAPIEERFGCGTTFTAAFRAPGG